MRKLWLFFQKLFSSPGNRTRLSVGKQAQRPRKVEDYIQLLHRNHGARISTIRLVGDRVSDTNVTFQRERIQTEDDQGNALEVDVYVSQTCSCLRIIDKETQLTGTCHICGSPVCAKCIETCSVSGCHAICCSRHRRTYQLNGDKTVTYCSRCAWRHWWRRWWGLYP